MSDSNQSRDVIIEREGRTWRWGESSYFKRWSGLKQTVSTAALKTIALPIALFLGIITFFFSGKRELSDTRGNELNAPNITHELPFVAPQILQNLPNQIGNTNVKKGVVGQIKIFNLRGQVEVPVGSEAKAILENGASNGIVKAKLLSPLFVDGEPLVPTGAVVFGRGRSTEERLFVEFKKLVLPNGETFPINAQALDGSDKILGLKGAFVGTRTKKFSISMGLGFLGGLADGLQTTSGSMWGAPQKKSLRDAALAGTSKAALDQSQAYIDEMKNTPTIIEVKRGTEFYLIIDEPKSNGDEL